MVKTEQRASKLRELTPKRQHPLFFRVMHFLARVVYFLSSRSVELGVQHTATEGGLLVACNHLSPYDVPCVLKASKRPFDFISLERFATMFFVGWFFRHLNVIFLKRGGDLGDSATLKEAAKRLRQGRAIGIFPEAEMRSEETSAIATGEFYEGFGKLAVLGRAKLVPAVVLDSKNFGRPSGWLPWPRTEWGVIYGEPIEIPKGCSSIEAAERLEQAWLDSLRRLEPQLRAALNERFGPKPIPE